MQQHVPYYRVSTDRQGRSGLGLDSQRSAVSSYLQTVSGEILAEFTEIESGRKSDRPQLQAAIELCKRTKAKLVIAKLDRLARNVYFVSGLMESGVDFVAVDMPDANRFSIHIMAAVAELERELISTRTKEALAAAKQRGMVLGNPRPAESLARGRQTIQLELDAYRAKVLPTLQQFAAQGLSYRAIARELNRLNVPTARGRQWHNVTVKAMLMSAAQLTD